MLISRVNAHQILDSRGFPTLEVHMYLDNGAHVSASAPSGSSIGKHEAVELRDRIYSSYIGLSVGGAVSVVNDKLAPYLEGQDPTKQKELDFQMIQFDGTEDKSHFGGNTLMATSAALTKAGAAASGMPLFAYVAMLSGNSMPLYLPTPMFNVLNGGLHGTGNLDFQEFLVVPARRTPYDKALQMGTEVYLNLKDVLSKKGLLTSVGDEGGFTPTLFTNVAALDLLVEAVRVSNYALGREVFIALDIAANQLRHGDRYFIKDSADALSSDGMIGYYKNLLSRYSILALEDPLAEDDMQGWKRLTASVVSSSLIVSDDLTVTSNEKIKKAIAEQAISGAVVKPNQIGTISEVIEVVNLIKEHDLTVIISHRSGETEDTFIADFAVGMGAHYFKAGAPARGERVAKYNRLLEIEEELAISAA